MEQGQLVADRFEVGPLAASGGMGRVYQAHDRVTGAQVALKVMGGAAEEALERFRREAAMLATLQHPGIVRYVAHGTSMHDEAWLAMEWLEGEDLRARLMREGLSLAETVALGRCVAEALGAAHAQGIVHRDVKPGNLFLAGGAPDRVKLLDLGVARLSGAAKLTETRVMIGTPAYMAPEQARGLRGVDARADVFALGAVLYECASGSTPFDAEHSVAVLAKVLLAPAVPLAERRDGVPEQLSELVARMLDKNPAKRPRDGAEVARALAALAGDVAKFDTKRVSRSEPKLSLTGDEQRLLCVLLGRPLAPVTLPKPDEVATMADSERPDQLARQRGADAAMLLDGSVVCTRAGGPGGPSAQAARAARLALALADAAPEMSFALATARAQHGSLPVGDAIERAAARLGPLGRVTVDEATASLLEERFELSRDGDHRLLEAERVVPQGVRTLLGRKTPYVGRKRELAQLEACLDECVEEPMGRPVVVIGDAGAGKSRLRYELLRRLETRDQPVTVWMGRGDPVSAGSAFGLVGRALKQAAGVRDDAPLAERHARLRAFTGRHLADEQAERTAEFLGEMLGVPFPDEHSVELRAARADARVMGDQMRLAFEKLVLAECTAGPLVLVLEDLQWGDAPSVSYVDSTLRVLGERPWLVLALARPEVHETFPGLWAERNVEQIRLGPLRPSAARELVRATLGDGAAGPAAERIVERAAGNAFALEELIRAEAEGRGTEVPETVLGLAEARLARLEPEARRVLRAASVFGETSWAGGVRVLLGAEAPAGSFDEWLELLAERELLTPRRESRLAGEVELAFRHALVREASYAMLTDADRRLGHQLAARWLEQRGDGIGASEPETLAYHYLHGGQLDEAFRYYRKAGEQSARAGSPDQAMVHFEACLRINEELPRTTENREAELLTLTQLGPAVAAVKGWSDRGLESIYTRALDLAEELTSSASLVAPLSGLWLFHASRSNFAMAHKVTERLMRLASDLGGDEFQMQGHHAAWPTHFLEGDLPVAAKHIEDGLCLYDEQAHARHAFLYMGHDPGVCGHAIGCVVSGLRGELGRARDYEADALGLARRKGHRPSLAHGLWFIALERAIELESSPAIALTDELLTLSEELRLAVPHSTALIVNGWATALRGELSDGLERLERGLELLGKIGSRVYVPFYLALKAGLIGRTATSEALRLLDAAVAQARETGEIWALPHIFWQRAELLGLDATRLDPKIEELLQTAIHASRRSGARLLELRASRALATWWEREGRHAQALDLLDTICTHFSPEHATVEVRSILEYRSRLGAEGD